MVPDFIVHLGGPGTKRVPRFEVRKYNKNTRRESEVKSVLKLQ